MTCIRGEKAIPQYQWDTKASVIHTTCTFRQLKTGWRRKICTIRGSSRPRKPGPAHHQHTSHLSTSMTKWEETFHSLSKKHLAISCQFLNVQSYARDAPFFPKNSGEIPSRSRSIVFHSLDLDSRTLHCKDPSRHVVVGYLCGWVGVHL